VDDLILKYNSVLEENKSLKREIESVYQSQSSGRAGVSHRNNMTNMSGV